MKKHEIKVGGLYLARVAGTVTTVRVDAIRNGTAFNRDAVVYDVTNLRTGRKTTFRSAAKFRGLAYPEVAASAIAVAPTLAACTCHPIPGDNGKVYHHADCMAVQDEDDDALPDRDPTPPEPLEPTGARGTHDGGEARELVPEAFPADLVPAVVEGEKCSDPTMVLAPIVELMPTPLHTTPEVVGSSTNTTSDVGTLAAKIATARQGRTRGTPVAGMVPNEEQEAILEVAAQDGLEVLVIGAGAGTGKTATLKMLEQVLHGRGQYTAFNSSLVQESKAKFTKAACNTTHSLAFHAVGKRFQHRLDSERMRSTQIATVLGIGGFTVSIRGAGKPIIAACEDCGATGAVDGGEPCPTCEGRGEVTTTTDRLKTLQPGFLAGQVTAACRRFCQSADREIGAQHIKYVDGIDVPDADGKRGHENNDNVCEYLLPFVRKAWADLTDEDGQLPFSHDCYVKIWQLGTGDDRPVIAADYILLDEAQDTAPVFLDVLKQQTHALLVFVGDDNQEIYAWRGACNAMRAYPEAPRRLLSQSYRFGQAVADVANTILATLEVPTDLVMRGNPAIPSRVDTVGAPRCYLYRTNGGALGRVMAAKVEGRRPYLVGGKNYVKEMVLLMEAILDLQAGRGTRHPELGCFESWEEVEEYSGTDEGEDLRLTVKLVEKFGARAIRDALYGMPKEEDADVVVSTAHRSKGREWPTVALGQDFPLPNKMGDEERRLLYVAATRAQYTLDVSRCPPFCGGYDYGETGNAEKAGVWVPGLQIAYTRPMPAAAEQAAWLAEKAAGCPATPSGPGSATPAPDGAPDAVVPAQGGGNGNGHVRAPVDGFTWTNFGGGWCLRGPAGTLSGAKVRAVRKNGTSSTEIIKTVVRKFDDAWIYGV